MCLEFLMMSSMILLRVFVVMMAVRSLSRAKVIDSYFMKYGLVDCMIGSFCMILKVKILLYEKVCF